MPTRIDTLTPEQQASLADYAQDWIRRGHRTGPMTDTEWDNVQDAIRACYRYTGLSEPKVIIRVPSPMVGALAAPAAALAIELRRRQSGAVGDAVGGAVGDAVRDAVRGAVRGAVGDAVDGAVDDAVRGAVGDAVDDAVDDAVGDAVDGAVDGAVGDAVDDAVGGAVARVIRERWYYRLGGQHWSAWIAWRSWFQDLGGLELQGDLWDRWTAYRTANSAGWVWLWRDFAMVADHPTELHVEQIAPTGWGSHRMHCETGPAIRWADGYAIWMWHGTRVPRDLIEGDGWTADRILREENTEVRRCAIERIGWDRFIEQAGLKQVGDTEPDPANPGHVLRLYDVPSRIYGAPVRVLLCTNASPERDGTRRRFGLTVSAQIGDPTTAAASLLRLTREQYLGLEHAS